MFNDVNLRLKYIPHIGGGEVFISTEIKLTMFLKHPKMFLCFKLQCHM